MKTGLLAVGVAVACFAPVTPAAEPAAGAVTAAAFGDIYDTSDGGKPMGLGGGSGTPPSGDTWYSTWAGDDTLYINVDDGLGFERGKGGMRRSIICMLTGNPNESTDGFGGINLNPGSRGETLPNHKNKGRHGYTSSLFELDGVLYQIRHSWSPGKELWPPIDSSIIKSPDGGRNWMDHLGRTNMPLTSGKEAMFAALPWSWMTFMQFGQGGAAPAADQADKYAYLTAMDYLVRVPREKLPDLNKADFQYYRGAPADGALGASWASNQAEAGKMACPGGSFGTIGTTVYNSGLNRYVGTSWAAYFAPGEGADNTGKARFIIWTAEHPWGPWTQVMSYGIWGRAGWNMLLANKYGSADGRKMWYVFCGEYKGDIWYYGFQYMPLYLSTGPVDTYEAEAAVLTGARPGSGYPGATGGYIENFTATGDRAQFEFKDVSGTGWHIVRLRYTSPQTNRGQMSIYVNGRKVKRVRFSRNNCDGKSEGKPELYWTDRSDIYYLNAGTNAFEIRQDAGDACPGLMLDSVLVSREPTYDEGVPLTPAATASASSGDASRIAGGCYGDEAGEWVAAGAKAQWIKLSWSQPQRVNKVRLYDRTALQDQVVAGTLSFSDGSTLAVGRLQNDGQAGTLLAFPARTVEWVTFTIDKVRPGTIKAGLGAFEVFGERK